MPVECNEYHSIAPGLKYLRRARREVVGEKKRGTRVRSFRLDERLI